MCNHSRIAGKCQLVRFDRILSWNYYEVSLRYLFLLGNALVNPVNRKDTMNSQVKNAHQLAANAPAAAAAISGPAGAFIRARITEQNRSGGNTACGHYYYSDTPAYDHTRE